MLKTILSLDYLILGLLSHLEALILSLLPTHYLVPNTPLGL